MRKFPLLFRGFAASTTLSYVAFATVFLSLTTCSSHDACSNCTNAPSNSPQCGDNANEQNGRCVCNDGYQLLEDQCVKNACEIPQAPTLSTIHDTAELSFTTQSGAPLEVGVSTDPTSDQPNEWESGSIVRFSELPSGGDIKVFARVKDPQCTAESWFSFVYHVQNAYSPAAGKPQTEAIDMFDPRIRGWATGWVEPVLYGQNVDETWKKPQRAVGIASGTSTNVVCLGDGGAITMSFDPPIKNGDGPDFAVFENSFDDDFLELGYVEVSSDGATFVRFDSAYLGKDPIVGFGKQDPSLIEGLAGKYRQGFGCPFDLQTLVNRPEVRSGRVNLSQIHFVRVVDIIGDGSALDSFGNTIYDPHPTTQSAGFDLDAIAVLHQ